MVSLAIVSVKLNRNTDILGHQIALLCILLDGDRRADHEWGLLLQIFSKNMIGPVFFEFIQRKGNDGFGEGNAQALFDSIERDQIQRGTLAKQL